MLVSLATAARKRSGQLEWQLYESLGIAPGDRGASAAAVLDNFRLFGAPHALILTTEKNLGTYGAIDCGVYVGALTLAAQSLGLGLIPQAALAMYAPLMRAQLGIPENRAVVLGASIGFPDETHPANQFRSRRARLEDAVQWVTDGPS